MKVQCDVCAAEAASVFCCADEAALCHGCDHRVHRANKVAGKHHRFSLLHPNSAAHSPPLCDICQEKRGFLFCKEDRAILCRDCDAPVHAASDITMKHSRFLLTGVRISAAAPVPVPPPEEAAVAASKRGVVHSTNRAADSSGSTATMASNGNGHGQSSCSSSSISEYLINMLPGWHVEDFLTDDTSTNDVSTSGSGFCKVDDHDAAQFMGMDRGRGGTERSCWVSRGGGVGLREVKRGRGKQQRQREVSIMAVPQPDGDGEWDDGHKRSRISVRYL